MWSGFCGDVIRKTNQRLLIVVLVLGVGLAIFFSYNHAYFNGFLFGPHTAPQGELLAARGPSAFPNAILKVDGGATAGTGLFETTTDKTHPNGYISARYLATEIGSRRLLVRVSPEHPLAQDAVDPSEAGAIRMVPSMMLTGQATALPASFSNQVAAGTNGDEAYLPYMLDVYGYNSFGWEGVIFGGIVLLAALWGAWIYTQRNNDPANDSFARGLARYGPLESIVPQLDADMASAHTTISRRVNAIHISQKWLAATTPFRAYGAKLDGVLWAYRLIVKRKMYGIISVGTRYTFIAYDRYGQKITLELDEPKTTAALQHLRTVAPQAIFGFDKRLDALWRANKSGDRIAFLTEANALLAGQLLPETVTRKEFHA